MPSIFTLGLPTAELLTQSFANLPVVTANYTVSTKLHETLLHSIV